MKFPKCVIFDFDGVIVKTEHIKLKEIKFLSKKYGVIFPNVPVRKTAGIKTMQTLIENVEKVDMKKFQKIVSERRKMIKKDMLNCPLIPGVKSLLKFLKGNDIKIYLSTASEREAVETFLKKKGINKYFDLKITGSEIKGEKTNPKFFLSATESFGFSPRETVVIEDSPSGISGAKKAGCIVFGIKTHFTNKDLKEADKIFNSHAEIKRFFEKIKDR